MNEQHVIVFEKSTIAALKNSMRKWFDLHPGWQVCGEHISYFSYPTIASVTLVVIDKNPD